MFSVCILNYTCNCKFQAPPRHNSSSVSLESSSKTNLKLSSHRWATPYALTILSLPDTTTNCNMRTAVIPFHRWLSKSLRVKESSKITHRVSEGTRDWPMFVCSQFLAPITSPQEGPEIIHSRHGEPPQLCLVNSDDTGCLFIATACSVNSILCQDSPNKSGLITVIVNLNGKRIWKRIDICIYITESLCCTPETNTRLLINYTLI